MKIKSILLAIAGLALASTAHAAIIYSNSASFSITGGAVPSGLMPLKDFSDIFDIIQYPGYSDPMDGDSFSFGWLDGQNPGQGAQSKNMLLGEVVSSSTTGWANQTFIGDNGTQYFGVSFNNAGTTNYGWLQATTSNYGIVSDTPNFTLVAFAYEDTGTPITVGAIPEPSALALLGLGTLGLVARRRRCA